MIPYAQSGWGAGVGGLLGGIAEGAMKAYQLKTQADETQSLSDYRSKMADLAQQKQAIEVADNNNKQALAFMSIKDPEVAKRLAPNFAGYFGQDYSTPEGKANMDAITHLGDSERKAWTDYLQSSPSLGPNGKPLALEMIARGDYAGAMDLVKTAQASAQQEFANRLEVAKVQKPFEVREGGSVYNPATGAYSQPDTASNPTFVGQTFAGPNNEMLIRSKDGRVWQLQGGGQAPIPYVSSSGGGEGGQGTAPTGGGGLTTAPKPSTEAQSKNDYLLGQMQLGDKALTDFLSANPDYLNSWTAKMDQMARSLGDNGRYVFGGLGAAAGAILGRGKTAAVVAGGGIGGAAGEAAGSVAEQWLTSDEGKQYISAATPFVTAALHKETGAAISSAEWSNAFHEWLPLPGDPPSVIAQKAEARATAIAGTEKGATPGQPRAQQPQQQPNPPKSSWEAATEKLRGRR